MKKILQYPFYMMMLPLFFVLHACLEHFGSLSFTDFLLTAAIYMAATVLLTGFFYWLNRNLVKAGILALIPALVFFFYTATREFLLNTAGWEEIARYRFLLTGAGCIFLIVVIYLRKQKKQPYTFTRFLNWLFIIFLLVDGSKLLYKSIQPDHHRLSVAPVEKNNIPACDTCQKPDIFLIIMDEYASSKSLKDQYNFDNDLDSFLLQKKFSIQTNSRSNYNYTVFSIASLLNMNYIDGIQHPLVTEARQHSNCIRLIRNNQVTEILAGQGYRFLNYSVFDVKNQLTEVEQTFVTSGYRLITGRTLFALLSRDLQKRKQASSYDNPYGLVITAYFDANKRFAQQVKLAAPPQSQPRFIYAHFMMPHSPFYYDKNGNPTDNTPQKFNSVEEQVQDYIHDYLGYIPYTNTVIKQMIDTIQAKNPGAVILLMGDHGFRPLNGMPSRFFENLNAVYFPGGDYGRLYDSITAVNQFRVLFNQLFRSKLPLLKDSSILIRNRH